MPQVNAQMECTDDLIARIYEHLKNIETVFHIKVLTEEDHQFFTKNNYHGTIQTSIR